MTHGPPRTRREALKTMGTGFGMMAFASLVGTSMLEASNGLVSSMGTPMPRPDFAPRAKNIIFLFMNGGVSQVDTFDPKPELAKYDGQPLPTGEIKTERRTGALMKSPFSFSRYGESGLQVSELFPHVGECADDICVIRSMHTEIPNHEPSLLMMNTGHIQPGRPSLGSWLTYGLGSENRNLPGFVVLCPDQPTVVGPPLWSNAFLPAIHQGTYISDKVPRIEDDFDPERLIPNIRGEEMNGDGQRREVDLVEKLNRLHMQRLEEEDPQIEGAIQVMETAYRMQTEAPDVFDIRGESVATQKLYGPGSTARGCLMAVRLVERGVRIVQVYYAKGDPGMLMRTSSSTERTPGTPTSPSRPWSRTSSHGASSTRPWWCAAPSSDARPCSRRGAGAPAAAWSTAATTTRSGSASGWLAAASRAA